MSVRHLLIAAVAALVGFDPAMSIAQQPVGQQVVTFQQQVEPSFRAEPIVHRFKARRGEVIPFEFVLESTGKPLTLEIKPVNLRQEESGVIMHDEATPAPTGLKLSTPGQLVVDAGAKAVIKGELTVPLIKSNFHSYGLLVRDKGAAAKFEPNVDAQGRPLPQHGVRFMTQYL